MNERIRLRQAWLVLVAACCLANVARAADSAVVLLYHHVAADTPRSTSITPALFGMQLDYLAAEGFHVWPLLRVLEDLRDRRPLPDKTVAITFDDAYVSILTRALPELKRHGWPFTVFVSTDAIDRKYGAFLSWRQLRQLAAAGATIGDHSLTHPHLLAREPGESDRDWAKRVRREIAGARRRIAAEMGPAAIPVFAYPYGEYDRELEKIVGSIETFAVGQQSGAVGVGSDLLAAPRFPMSTGYDSLAQFALKVRVRPLPVTVLAPSGHVLADGESLPQLHLQLGAGHYRIGELACYASGQGRIIVDWVDRPARKLIVRPRKPLRPGRTKYNCTAPSNKVDGVFYWYSYLWMKKNPDGSWYNE